MQTGPNSKFDMVLAGLRSGEIRGTKIELQGTKLSAKDLDLLMQILADDFATASSITEIDLSHTNVTHLPKKLLKDCDNLRKLNLGNNKLHTLPDLPDRPYQLQHFNAAFNPLKKIQPKYFHNCISLKTVLLKHAQLESPPSLEDSLSLSLLYLSDNPIHKFPSKYFRFMQNLDMVFLNNTKIHEIPDLSECVHLQEVWVDKIKMADAHLQKTTRVIVCPPQD